MSIERRAYLTDQDRSGICRDRRANQIISEDSARLLRGRSKLPMRCRLLDAMDKAGVLSRGEMLSKLGAILQDEERADQSLQAIVEHQHRMIVTPGCVDEEYGCMVEPRH
jgi:hypothetical protein